jgi:predicted nucleic acid-binding protein
VTTVIVNDASCLIDLQKGRLLHVMVALPFRFVVPFTVRESELLKFTAQEWQMLEDGGLETHDLSPNEMGEAQSLQAQHPALSTNDAICLVTTVQYNGAILLTGDAALRRVAEAKAVQVHGVLWLLDELRAAGVANANLLRSALMTWRDDPTVRLPLNEIEKRLRGR